MNLTHLVSEATKLLQLGGPIAGMFLIFCESMIPALPLGVFIALNMNAFGFFFGFIISWISTCIGCYVAYLLSDLLLNKLVLKKIPERTMKKILKIKQRIEVIPFSNLVVIIALPFTPAFLINIAAGFAKMKKKKFITAILIGKLSIVYFWGFVGTSLIKSLTDIKAIINITVVLLIAYFVSKYVSAKAHIE